MTTEDPRILSGLLWIATTPASSGPSPFDRAEAIVRGVGSMRRAGVPEALIADAYRPDLQDTVALETVRRWVDAPRARHTWEAAETKPRAPRGRGTLVLRGTVGTGKSAAMAKMLAMRIDLGLWRAKWVDCRSLVADDWTRVNALGDYLEIPCLMLDDLSADVVNREGAKKAIAALLGQRHEQGRLTVITSNLSEDAIKAAADAALWDRIGQSGEVVTCEGESLRGSVEIADLDATILDADRLAQLVRRLDRGRVGDISDEVWRLPHGEAVRQLGRLLGVTQRQARLAADEVDAHDERCRQLAAELAAKISGTLHRPPGHVEQDPIELAHARQRRQREVEDLLERDAAEDLDPRELSERKRLAKLWEANR
jgi:hypothetical protein